MKIEINKERKKRGKEKKRKREKKNLVGGIGTQVNGKSKSNVILLNNISKFFRAFKFVFLKPFFKKVFLSLHQHRTCKFKRFILVELSFFKEDTKVLEKG